MQWSLCEVVWASRYVLAFPSDMKENFQIIEVALVTLVGTTLLL